MINANPDQFVDAEAVAKHFGVAIPTINRWVREGRIPCVRASRRIVRFRLAEVEDALRQGVAVNA